MTMSQLLMTNESFLSTVAIDGYDNNPSSFFPRFIALFYIGEMLGALLAFPLFETIGRKFTLIYASVACICMLTWCTVTESGANVLSSRFCMGWAMGVLVATAPVYCSEISVDECRGQNIAFLSFAMAVGSLVSCIVYALLFSFPFGWRLSLLVPIAVLTFKFGMLCYLPDSPRWLLASKTPPECLSSMRRLRLTSDVNREFNGIYRALTSDARLGDGWGDLFIVSKSVRVRMLLCLFIQLQQQMVGVQVITVYGFDLLHNEGLRWPVFAFLVLAVLAGVAGSAVFLRWVDDWGRRPLLLLGCGCMSAAWALAALCAYFGGSDDPGPQKPDLLGYLPRFFFGLSICFFCFAYSFSLGPISWVLPNEIFPHRARAKAVSVSAAVHFAVTIVGSGILKMALKDQYRKSLCLLSFSLLAALSSLVVYAALPETKGIMLEDMEELFRVDPDAYCCGCLPELKSGLLGLRVLQEGQKSMNKFLNTNAVGYGPFSADSASPLNVFVEPSTLHKYSNYMRETKFQYLEDKDETIAPSFNLFGSSSSSSNSSSRSKNHGLIKDLEYR